MSSAVKRSPLPLRDVLYEFSLAKNVPDAELLDQFVTRYPEFAGAITDYAVEVVLESLRTKEAAATENPQAVSAAVSRAMSKFQNALFAKAAKPEAPATKATGESGELANLLGSLDRKSFKALAVDLNINNVFLIKLRDRQIDPTTIPNGFRSFVARKLKVPRPAVDSYFAESSSIHAIQFYKADAKPETKTQQSFADAVRTSGLSDEQQQFLLGL